jgi:hypothetical protein
MFRMYGLQIGCNPVIVSYDDDAAMAWPPSSRPLPLLPPNSIYLYSK